VSKSPDLSVIETFIKPIKDKFFKRRVKTEAQARQRLNDILNKLDLKKFQKNIDRYTARLHECNRSGGEMTRF
jgi:mevalonate pyrophosphate decarboxylase